MRERFSSYLVVFSLLCFGGSILYILGPSPCLGVEAVAGDVTVFSLDVKGKPLGEVLKEIEKSTSYKISVDERWVNFPMTVTLKNVGVEEGLRRLLRGFNHALIVSDEEKQIYIDIRVPAEQRKVKPAAMEVLPPKIPGEKGTTLGELQANSQQQRETNPQDMEVVPPMGPNQPGMTVRQLKALEKQRQKEVAHQDMEVVPPMGPDQPGMTARQLKALEAKQKPKDIGVIPPPVLQSKGDVMSGKE